MKFRSVFGALASKLVSGMSPAVTIVAAAVLLFPSAASAQINSTGNDFIVGFLNNSASSTPSVELHLTSSVNMSVQIEYPVGTNLGSPVALVPGTVSIVSISASAANGWPTGTPALNGVRASSVNPAQQFTCYMINRAPFTSDAALALPIDSLGAFYRVITATPTIGGNQIFGSQFVVVATQDGTTVTITPSHALQSGQAAGVPFNVNLNRGQGWFATGTTSGVSGDLTGSSVQSNLPVEVTNGVGCVNIDAGTCDHVFEVAQPVQTWGTGIPAANLPGFAPNGVRYRIMAAADNTTVFQDGASIGLLNAGQFLDTPRLTGNHFFDGMKSSKPKAIFVMQLMPGEGTGICADGDPSIGNIVPAAQYLPAYTFSTVGGNQFLCNFVTIIAANADVGVLTLDAVPVPAANFTAIGASGYSVAVISISSGSHHTASPNGHGITVEGYNQDDSYLYPGGAGLNAINVDLVLTKDDQTTACVPLGGTITYQMCYQNTGDEDAHNVLIVDTLPAEEDFVSATGGGVYDAVLRTVTWTVALAPANMQSAICFDLKVSVNNTATPGEVIVNAATIDSDESDPTPVQEETEVCRAPEPFCFGDGTAGPCPCANNGSAGNGCANSINPAGANLSATGTASVTAGNDTMLLTASGQSLNKFSMFIQSATEITPTFSGDGRLCLGSFLRMYTVTFPSGFPTTTSSAPSAGSDPTDPITVRSAFLGDPITAGSVRSYQVFYRNADESFCVAPVGDNWNLTNGIRVTWGL
jgi:uncharacterized repeat protein (TIGR01451 family)